jgi:effector-binding domain-containing protein
MAAAQVGIEAVPAAPMAAVAARAAQQELAQVIRTSLDKVYAVLRAGDFGPLGCNVVYYGAGGWPVMDLKIGVRLEKPMAVAAGEVIPFETPACQAAHAVHFGHYSKLRPAHEAAKAAATRQGRSITGASWEVYGDWTEDLAQLRTDVFWQLEGETDA